MPLYRVLMAALVLLFTVGTTSARTLDQVPPYFEKEGHFVSYPALAGGGLGGLVGSILALPAALVAAPIGWMAGDTLGYTMIPISVMATAGAEVGYHVGGAVPWALKSGLYDAPMAGIAKIKGEPASGLVAQVDPPPRMNPVDIQYLSSTPADARIPIVPPREYSIALAPPKEPTSLMLKRALSPFKLPPGTPGAGAFAAKAQTSLARQSVLSTPQPAPGAAAAALPKAGSPAPAVQTSSPPAVVTPPPAPVRVPVRTADSAPPSASPAPNVTPSARMPASPNKPTTTPDDASATATDEGAESERPSLKKKKRKFSERFGF